MGGGAPRVLGAIALLYAASGPGGFLAAQGKETPADTAAARARFWIRPAASLVLPGSGQLLAHDDHGALYIAAEVYLLSRFLQLDRTGRQDAQRFRDLAFGVARGPFVPAVRDTTFEYFEQMEKFDASGRFSLGPGAAIVPEDDPTTYNGAVWLLARHTYWDDPTVPPPPDSPPYLRALQFYVSRAIGPNFLWSWRNATLEQQEFRLTIRRSDDAFRQAQNELGLLLANHLVSAIDAVISNRLSAAAGRSARLATLLGPGHSMVYLRVAF